MRKLIALLLCVASSSALADSQSPPTWPLARPFPDLQDAAPDKRDLMAHLPDLGSSGGSDWFRSPAAPAHTPFLLDRGGPRSQTPGGPWYWEQQPLYVPPAP